MAQLKDLAESRAALMNFDPRKLRVKEGLNARDLATPDNEDHVEMLVLSMMEHGYIPSQPMEIFMDGSEVYVSNGHCRLTAVMRAISRGAPIETVTCVPERRGTNDIDRILGQSLHNSGKRLTPIEEGHNIKRAINMGASIKDVAAKLGKSETFVAQALDFQSAPAEIHNMVRSGEVSATLAAKTMRREGQKGAETIKKAVASAKAKGKTKATEKDVDTTAEAAHNERTNPIDYVRIREKPGDCLGVTLGRTEFILSRAAWERLAHRILDMAAPPTIAPLDSGWDHFDKTAAH